MVTLVRFFSLVSQCCVVTVSVVADLGTDSLQGRQYSFRKRKFD